MALVSHGAASGDLRLGKLEPETSVDFSSWAGRWGSRTGDRLGIPSGLVVVEAAAVGSLKAVGYPEGGASAVLVVVLSGHMVGAQMDCPQSLGLPGKQALLSHSLRPLLLGLQISNSGPS